MRILVRFLPLLSSCLAAKSCFFPNGKQAPKDYPCNPTSEESACCGETAICLTNKLCRTPGGDLIRGTCTDKDWNSAECVHYCLTLLDGGEEVISCSNVTGSDPQYCCERGRAFCCDNGKGRFQVFPPNPQILAKWDASASSVVVLLQQTSAASSSSSGSSSASDSTFSSTTTSAVLNLSSITNTTRSSAAATPTITTSTTSTEGLAAVGSETNTPSSPGLPVATRAGIGVSVGIAVILLVALAFVLRKLRQNKKALQAERERAEALMTERGVPPPELGRKPILDGTPRSELYGGMPGAGSMYDYHEYGELPAPTPTVEVPVTPGRPFVDSPIVR